MAYLLDSNSWIHYLKHANSPIRTRLASLAPMDVVTCSLVRAELLHGAEKYGNRDRRVATVVQTLAPFRSPAFDDEAAATTLVANYTKRLVDRPATQIYSKPPLFRRNSAIRLCFHPTAIVSGVTPG